MPIYKVSEIERFADQAKTSVIAFNCLDYNTIKSVIKSADEAEMPVICMLYPEHHHRYQWITPRAFATIVKEEAEKVKVPVGLHLDHCTDFDYIMNAIDVGFSSVMYDGSMLALEENIANTRAVTKAAHAKGAEVEAELGHVGFASNVKDQNDLDLFTKPDVAKYFCEVTECDAIAIAIGSAHGFYKETPNLDIERLKAINSIVDVPLVLHGGSGIPKEQLEIAFREGINKFNIGTEFLWLYRQTVKNFESDNLAEMARVVQEALREYLLDKLTLSDFSSVKNLYL